MSSSVQLSQAVKSGPSRRGAPLPRFVPPQLSQPVEKPPLRPQWLHEIKLDGYRMAERRRRDDQDKVLQRHVKHCSFGRYFKWLSRKRKGLAARVATLSQHLFSATRRHALESASRHSRMGFATSPKWWRPSRFHNIGSEVLGRPAVSFAQIPLKKPSSILSWGISRWFWKGWRGSFERLLGRHPLVCGQHF